MVNRSHQVDEFVVKLVRLKRTFAGLFPKTRKLKFVLPSLARKLSVPPEAGVACSKAGSGRRS